MEWKDSFVHERFSLALPFSAAEGLTPNFVQQFRGNRTLNALRTTVLNPVHRDLQAKLVEFGGFEMPVQYSSIVEEHNTVRNSAGLFDLCHMGRFEIRGAGAVEAIDALVTCNTAKMPTGRIRYALVPNENGGVRDDILVYKFPDSVFLVVNAGNRDKLLEHFETHLSKDVEFHDRSEELAMIAVQGPAAHDILAPVTSTTWIPTFDDLGYYKITAGHIDLGGERYDGWISRTGYTGENGFEIYVDSHRAADLWNGLTELAGDRMQPCGLGSRDTLRMEAGMPLYGHELGEEINPYEVGLGSSVKLKKATPYLGLEALRKIKEEGASRRLIGFVVDGKRVARDGMALFCGDREVGVTTSGAPSPTLGKNIVMGLVAADVADDAAIEVDIRGRRMPLLRHELPFYKREA